MTSFLRPPDRPESSSLNPPKVGASEAPIEPNRGVAPGAASYGALVGSSSAVWLSFNSGAGASSPVPALAGATAAADPAIEVTAGVTLKLGTITGAMLVSGVKESASTATILVTLGVAA